MTSKTAWFDCTEPGVMCRLMSFSCPGAWSLQCVTDSAVLVQHTQGQALETPACSGEPGQHLHICLLAER